MYVFIEDTAKFKISQNVNMLLTQKLHLIFIFGTNISSVTEESYYSTGGIFIGNRLTLTDFLMSTIISIL
jgi:hypothetical protein